MKKLFVVGLCCLILIAYNSKSVACAVYKEIDVKNGGTIRGTITLKGTPPAPEVIPVSRDGASCGKSKSLESLIVGKNGGVKNVIVGLEGITQGKAMPMAVKPELDQLKCEYAPHILIVPRSANLEIMNSDPILHNVHAYDLTAKADAQTGAPTLFNIAIPIKGMKIAKPMSQAGLVRMLCDAGHPWMNAYILVTDHPYFAVTDENGNFTLENVPPGTYTITIWHEGLAKIEKTTKSYSAREPCKTTRKVTVTSGGIATVNFTLSLSQQSGPQEALLSAE